ncbi:hypothetical protein IIB34_02815 [PVC group bacterium]|nr:hypothetical protein [PVC group bacterium]
MKTSQKRIAINLPRTALWSFFLFLFAPQAGWAASSGSVAVTVTIEQIAGVEVSAPTDQSGDPNETLNYLFNVQNTGSGPDNFDLTTESTERFRVNLPQGKKTGILNPGETAIVSVETTIPEGEAGGVQDILTLKAKSQINRKVFDTDFVTTTVNTAAGIHIDPPRDKSDQPGKTVSYNFTLANSGNVIDQYQLTASSSLGWAVNLPDGSLSDTLTFGKGGGTKQQIVVEVTIDPAAANGTVDELTLIATSLFAPSLSVQASVNTTAVIRGRNQP